MSSTFEIILGVLWCVLALMVLWNIVRLILIAIDDWCDRDIIRRCEELKRQINERRAELERERPEK